MKRQIFPFYCKFNDRSGKEQRVGVEISEGVKKLTDSYADQEGRVVARFFNTTMSKETQIRYTMEPAEAFEVYMLMMKVFRSPAAIKDKLPPHKFSKDGKDVMTNLTIEKWVRGEKSGYALACQRREVSHNVSLREGTFLYAAEVFKSMSVQCNWQDAKPTRDDAVSALTTIKNHLNSKPQAVGLLKQLHAMITGSAPAPGR